LTKGLDILFAFTRLHSSLTVKEIAQAVRVPLPTAYRFVKVLSEKGFLERDTAGRYRLGLRLLELEGALHHRMDLETAAKPLVGELARISEETVQLTLLRGDQGICVFVEESPSTLRVAPERGRVVPLHAGASVQAMLAFLPREEQENILARPLKGFTPDTITDPGKLRRRLQAIRRNGYAVTRGELYPGAVGIAAPVFDREHRVVASIAVSGPAQRIGERQKLIAEHTVRVARKISRTLGWHQHGPSLGRLTVGEEGSG